jgi:EAL domain-containing protein (putative c-di-GMP-specific phosphodiesterase class I)
VKIEKSFIDSISTSPAQLALVEGIVRLAHTLGLEVVAEGIETPADRDLLATVGCQYGQGFLFSRPLSYVDAVKWLRSANVPV